MSDLVQTGLGQLQLVIALFVICGFLAIVFPLLVERIARRGY